MSEPLTREDDEPQSSPFKIEVESERTETIKTYGVVRPDGAMGGTFHEDRGDAEEEADLLAEGWLLGTKEITALRARLAEVEQERDRMRAALAKVEIKARKFNSPWSREIATIAGAALAPESEQGVKE